MREPRFPSLAKRRKALAVGAVALGLVALAACNPAPDKKTQNIVAVGSDTTQTAMATLSALYNVNAKNTDPDSVYNILAVQTAAQTVPADSQADCAATTYHTPAGAGEVLAPNGSGAGRDALKASVANGDGCITIARSSSGPRAIGTTPGTDNSTFEYYAYALDAVGWGSTSAPGAVEPDPRPAPGHLQLHLHRLEPGGRQRRPDPAVLAAVRLGHALVLPELGPGLRPDHLQQRQRAPP